MLSAKKEESRDAITQLSHAALVKSIGCHHQLGASLGLTSLLDESPHADFLLPVALALPRLDHVSTDRDGGGMDEVAASIDAPVRANQLRAAGRALAAALPAQRTDLRDELTVWLARLSEAERQQRVDEVSAEDHQ